MSFRFNSHVTINQGQITTATTGVIAGPIDISSFETFSLLLQNQHATIGVLSVEVQVTFDSSENVGTGAPNWVALPTSTAPLPSATVVGGAALSASSSYMTKPITNAWHYLRIVGGMSATATGNFRVTVGGMTRR